MLISANFVPSKFEILDFYGEEMCFAWSNNKLVIFPYVKSVATSELATNFAPRDIRSLRCFDGRVFVHCEPAGVYKLLRTYKYSTLSSVGIANGPAFYEVFVVENNWLHSQNKSTKTDRALFQLESLPDRSYNLRDMTLNAKNSELGLRRAICMPENDCDEDVCVLTNNKRVFKITQSDAQLIYRSEREIIDVVGILRGESVAGMALVTSDAAVLVYVIKGKLIFDKVYLEGEVRGLCAGMSNDSEDTIWLAHIDGTRIHYWVKTISDDTFRKTNMEYMRLVAIKNYKSKLLICLSDTSRLLEISIDSLGLGKNESEEFFGLKSEMLKGSERIVDAICERAKELQNWNETLLLEQDKLKRINIYSHKLKIVHLPEVRVERIAERLFAEVKFQRTLPLNCHVIVAFNFDRQTTYCLKYIEDSETTLGLVLENERLDHSITIRVDLVTVAEESRAWCLIRNYTKNPKVESDVKVPIDRSNFLNAKLAALRNLTSEGGLSMKKLSAIKKSIRRELKNL